MSVIFGPRWCDRIGLTIRSVCFYVCPCFQLSLCFFLHILTKADFSFVVTSSRMLEQNHPKKKLAEETLYLLMPLPYDGIYIYIYIYLYVYMSLLIMCTSTSIPYHAEIEGRV